jgi:hypothetical protein
VQIVRGDGYRFAAPSDWPVERTQRTTAAARGEVDRVQVTTFRLVKRYRPALFAAAAVELDGAAAKLAHALRGHVVHTATVRAAGRRARQYRIAYGDRTQELTFVLDGRREYQLLCRRAADAADDVCRRLVRSFELA